MADQRPPAAAVSERSWTITGASAETRELVREAAAKDGLTIRAWVDKTLNAAAKAALEKSPGGAADGSAETSAVADLSAKMDVILSRLGADAHDATASLQAPLAAVYERFLKRTASVFDELADTSRRLADAAADAESEAARAVQATPAKPPAKSSGGAAPAAKPRPAGKPSGGGTSKAPTRAKPSRKTRGKGKKRPPT